MSSDGSTSPSRRGKYPQKYFFNLLEINESTMTHGTLSAIRTAASAYGRRYGIWLRVDPAPGGAHVTRMAKPLDKRTRTKLTIEERLTKVEDGVRFVAIMVTKIHKLLEESHE